MLLLESMDQDPNRKGNPLPTVERDLAFTVEHPDEDDPQWLELCAAIGHNRAFKKANFGTVDRKITFSQRLLARRRP